MLVGQVRNVKGANLQPRFITNSFDVDSKSLCAFLEGKMFVFESVPVSSTEFLFLDFMLFTVALNKFVTSAMLLF